MTNEINQNAPGEIKWAIRVPILKSGLILKQLGLTIGIPFGMLTVFLFVIQAYFGLLIVGVAVIFSLLLVSVIFRGTYDVEYILDQKGILCRNQTVQKDRVKKLSAAAFGLGLLSHNYAAAGAGALAGAGTEIKIPWKRIRKIKFNDKSATVSVYAGIGQSIALFCTEDRYPATKRFIQNKTGPIIK